MEYYRPLAVHSCGVLMHVGFPPARAPDKVLRYYSVFGTMRNLLVLLGCGMAGDARGNTCRQPWNSMWDRLPNVTYDAHSTVPLDHAMESEYVYSVLATLRERMGESFSTYSFSVFTCGNPAIRPASLTDPHPRKVLIYTADESGTLPLELAEHYIAIFKGYLPHDRKPGNIFPLPLGCVNGVTNGTNTPPIDRELDVFSPAT